MAPRLRRLSARDVLRIFKSFGFEVVATRGNHAKLRRVTDDGRRETLTLPLQSWNLTLSQLAIFFEGRLDDALELCSHD
jgi:predicted RNA binding protein YcfA (HicA-like mRNA interferase family)